MSTYYPYFRGKQYELILLRDFAPDIAQKEICPIIEPVRQNPRPLLKALESLRRDNVPFVLVVNPQVGDYRDSGLDGSTLLDISSEVLSGYDEVSYGIVVSPESKISQVKAFINDNESLRFSPVHCGFSDGRGLADALNGLENIREHIFFENHCRKLYQRRFAEGSNSAKRVLLRDGFQIRKNSEYPPVERFSDLHITYVDEGMDGFGDFLIVGDEYREQGGPAYAVAIHVTFVDPEQDEEMFICHFVSDKNSSPTDPAGKFGEALSKLVNTIGDSRTPIFQSRALQEFQRLHQEGHFPGLGKVKQISMQHHVELMADYLSRG